MPIVTISGLGAVKPVIVDGNGPTRPAVSAPHGTALPAIPINPAPAVSSSPVPAGFPTTQFYQAVNGSVWRYNSSTGQWFQARATPVFNPPVSIAPAQPVATPSQPTILPSSATPPPLPAPIQLPPAAVPQPIVSATPTFTATEATATVPLTPAMPMAPDAATAAGQFAPGTEYINSSSGSVNIVPTPPTASEWIAKAEAWLQSSTLIPNVPNYWLVGGAILAGMFLSGGGKRRR